ncbi:hypothetical protein PBI_SCTP2_312 [Salicola phage SCTP-2]|nr:hypothetical protein PBI_SCTP2_312 [Salicola phage SCTP-2]
MTEQSSETPKRLIKEPEYIGQNYNMIMSEFISNVDEKRQSREALGDISAKRWVCGFPLPEFQRPSVWTLDQKVSYIETIWCRQASGSFVIVEEKPGSGLPFQGCIIDGQQRLEALEEYVNDEFKVYGYYWSELTNIDRRSFKLTRNIPVQSIRLYDESKLRELYNKLNFAGTPHKESEKA